MFAEAMYDTVYIEVNDAYTFKNENTSVSTIIFTYVHFCVVFELRIALVGVDTCTELVIIFTYNKLIPN
jgi:hypothetical protein